MRRMRRKGGGSARCRRLPRRVGAPRASTSRRTHRRKCARGRFTTAVWIYLTRRGRSIGGAGGWRRKLLLLRRLAVRCWRCGFKPAASARATSPRCTAHAPRIWRDWRCDCRFDTQPDGRIRPVAHRAGRLADEGRGVGQVHAGLPDLQVALPGRRPLASRPLAGGRRVGGRRPQLLVPLGASSPSVRLSLARASSRYRCCAALSLSPLPDGCRRHRCSRWPRRSPRTSRQSLRRQPKKQPPKASRRRSRWASRCRQSGGATAAMWRRSPSAWAR
jgi:hypothetical protein